MIGNTKCKDDNYAYICNHFHILKAILTDEFVFDKVFSTQLKQFIDGFMYVFREQN